MKQNDAITDNELIQSFIKGNESSLEKLVTRHQQKILTSIYVLVKNRELAEDLFQETFIKVINTLRAGHYHDEGKFLPWVTRIAHNLVIDYFRKNNRMPMVRDTEDYSIIDNLKLTDDSIEDRMVKDRIHEEVRLLVEELPFEQREVVIMRHYGELSFREIAEITNVSINTALGRMRYALINMRRLIEKEHLMLMEK
jgi:RNA polymerase sigma factor (sigma-70 family)